MERKFYKEGARKGQAVTEERELSVTGAHKGKQKCNQVTG